MATLLAHIVVKPGAEARFEAVARQLFARTHADEHGVLRYEYWRASEPRSYGTLLAFRDHHAFLAHQTSPHHEDAAPELGEIIESIRLEWIDPVPGASPLPPTVPQEVPADADDLTRRYARYFAVHLAAWWPERPGSDTVPPADTTQGVPR